MFGDNSSKKEKMNIIIVGCGRVGSTIVEQLSKEGNNITIIDKDSEVIETLTNLYDVMGVVGNGATYSVQMEAGIENTDLFIAVTESDELNLLCCTVAKRVSNCSAIARVRTPEYSKEAAYLKEKLGLAMIINPDLEASREIARILALPSALEVNSFAHGQAELIKYKVPSESMLDNLAIMNIGKVVSQQVLICAIERDGEVYIPSGNFIIKEGDIITFVATRKQARKFFLSLGSKVKHVRDCMIIGGGKTTHYLADQLLHAGINVKIIEKKKKRCQELSTLLPKAIIINGDGTDEELLREEGIETIESFVPLTGIDEENIMLTLYARQVSPAKVITKINHINFKNVVNNLDLGSVIYPRYLTSEAIVAYARAKKDSLGSNIETLYHLFDSRVEAIEFLVRPDSRVINVPLMELALKKNLLIAFINRNGAIIIPSGQDCIHPGDTVMIVTTHTGFNDIEDILE